MSVPAEALQVNVPDLMALVQSEIETLLAAHQWADMLYGPLTDRWIRFDDYRLGECLEDRDRLQMQRRWATARFKVST